MKVSIKPEHEYSKDYICVNDIHIFPIKCTDKKYIRYSEIYGVKYYNYSSDDFNELDKEGYTVIENPLYQMTQEEIDKKL